MTREDLKNKTLEEIIKQINEENQDGIMTKEEIISLQGFRFRDFEIRRRYK